MIMTLSTVNLCTKCLYNVNVKENKLCLCSFKNKNIWWQLFFLINGAHITLAESKKQ